MFISEKQIEVRYAETDQMGVVYHANYLIWMEVGRTHLIKELGFNYAAMESEGVVSPVLDLQISYKKPVRYGQTVTIRTWIDEYDGFRVGYGYEILNEKGEVATISSSTHICVDKESFRPVKFKKRFPDWHERYENAKRKE